MKILTLLMIFLLYTPFSFGIEGVTRIDMASYETIHFDSLVKTISCTRLGEKNSSAFNTCLQVIPYKDYLYVVGQTISGGKVDIYTGSGKFVKEITFADALLLNSLSIIPALDQFWVISRLRVINKFKLDGTLVKRISLPFPCACLYPVANQNFLIYTGGGNRTIEGHSIALTDFRSVDKLFLKKEDKKENPFSPQSMYAPDINPANLFVFPDHTDTIYRYTQSTKEMHPYYFLDFHRDFLTKDKYPTGKNEDREIHEIITKRTYIHSQYSFYQASGRLFFKLVGKRNDYCTINLKDHSLSAFDRLFDGFESKHYNPFVGSDGKSLYLLAQEKDLVKHYKTHTCTYPSIRKILPTLSANGEGWIMLTIEIKASTL